MAVATPDDNDQNDDDDALGAEAELQDAPPVKKKGSGKGKGKGRRIPEPLPEDDPFSVIDRLDANGGIDGTRERMTYPAMEAFRYYCRLPPFQRGQRRLRAFMQRELGYAPSHGSITTWSSKHGWPQLVKEYDSALHRWRLYKEEETRLEAQERHRQNAKVLQSLSARQIQKLIKDYNAPDPPAKVDKRTGKPVQPKKKSLAGLQALAMTYKIAVDSERVALGLPTTISDNKLDATVDTTNHIEVSLADWRKRTASERGETGPRAVEAGPGSGSVDGLPPRALPAPRERARVAGTNTLADLMLDDDERDMLPDEWFDDQLERVVDADPLSAHHQQQTSDEDQ